MKRRHTRKWPYRQADPKWAKDIISVKDKLIGVHLAVNGRTLKEVEDWDWGDTIETDGCLLTSLAMTLDLLAPRPRSGRWTPRTLNTEARNLLYYSDAGLSIVPLYADLVADVTHGRVQLCAQEQYFSGEMGRRWRTPKQCPLLRGYRALPKSRRLDFAVMLKLGTQDDNFASHYVLVDPDLPGSPDDDDVAILDPDQPVGRVTPWYLSDSYSRLAKCPDILLEWGNRIHWKEKQLAGVWVFGRWRNKRARSLAGDLLTAIADS